MKKLFLSLIVACTIVGAASAQEYFGVGIGYSTVTLNEENLGTEHATKINSLSIAFEGFMGETLGFYSAGSFGLPTKVTSGTTTVSMDYFETKMHVDGVFGLGYRFISGEFDFIVAGGVGVSSTLLTYVNSILDPFLVSTLGPGGALSAAYNMSEKYAFYASIHGYYGVAQLSDKSDYFKNSVVITPAAGLRIRVR